MMNAAMDRWGIASSSAYQNHINDNKENTSSSKASNPNTSDDDDSKKKRNPLSQKKQDQQQIPKSQDDISKSKQKQKQLRKKKASDNKSYSDSSSGSKGSRRHSSPVAQILGGDDEEAVDYLPPPIIHSMEEMNEVSTIAGDTFAGIEMDAAVAEAVPPYNGSTSPYDSAYGLPMPIPPFANTSADDAMITPTYSVLRQNKKRLSRLFLQVNPDVDEESTLPESPENNNNDSEFENAEQGSSKGYFSTKKKEKPNVDKSFFSIDENDDYEDKSALFDDSDKKSPKRRRFQCIMCAGCVLAFILLMGIAMLGYTLYAIRHEDEGALSLFTREFWGNAGDKIAFWKKKDEEPEEFLETIAPTVHHTSLTSSGTSTYVPTQTEKEISLSTEMEQIRSIVLLATADNGITGINKAALSNPSSMQFSVMEWLSSDASLDSYSEEKILQRYALGCFYKSLLGEEENNATKGTWMGYGDECTEWTNTETNPNQPGPCNEQGQIRSIHLENSGFSGTLSPELAFLSDSLESLYLTKNKIHGTIPSAYGQLTSLKRLQLSRNKLEGTIDGQELLLPLKKLEIIGLGGNKLSGPIPEELGSMPGMIYINIPYNEFTGTIPSSWNTTKINHVNFAYNELTGPIPPELTSIETLNNLFLAGNDGLHGSVTSSVCIGATNNATTYNDMKMTVDCESVRCSCCGCDGVTPPPGMDDGLTTDSTTTVDIESVVPVIEVDSSIPETEDDSENFPIVDNDSFNEALEVLNGALPGAQAAERYGCQTIDVGFQCYTTGWSIDFELSNDNCGSFRGPSPPATTEYDLVAIYPFEGDVQGPSKVGTLKSLGDALFWATSCGLTECDGVIANGQVYYRNTYPQKTAPLSALWWPIAPNSMMQVLWIRVEATGTAIVLAESQPFLVSRSCR